jgi:YbbR domain-containing protein
VRVLRFFFRNWLLKIGAVLVAVLLYGAMVFLQSSQQWPGTVAIELLKQPANATLLDANKLPQVGSIRYIAAPDVPISQSTFRATADLSTAKVSETDQSLVLVKLEALDPRVQIIDYKPQQITVHLDPISQKQVGVVVNTITPPAGLQPGTPVVSTSTVQVSGAAFYVSKVAYAQALVRIDESGLDVSQDVDLVARSAAGDVVDNVTFNPRTVHVQIQVGSQSRTESVPVNPITSGSQAAGYNITSIEINPPIVSVRGQADALAKLNGKANTKPISIAGATGDVSANVSLDLPADVTSDTTNVISVVIHLSSPASTRSVAVGVSPVGTRSDRIYSLSTPSIIVTLGGATAALNAFDTSTLVGTVSVAGLDVGTYSLLVSVSVPPGITVQATSPAQITVTIATPPSPSPPPITATPTP